MTDKFIIGTIGSSHGLNGHVKVRSMSGEIDHLLNLKEAAVVKDGKELRLKIEENAPYPPSVLMRFEGFDTPEKAKTLTGACLVVGREQAAPLNEGEFYIEDLKGLPVLSTDGETVGHITDIIEGGGGDLAEIKLANGEARLVPFRKEFFAEINPEKGRLVLQNTWVLE